MIERRTIVALGLGQLVSWGVTYYLIGGFGEQISAELGWSRATVYGGFALSLLVMGLASPVAGWLVDRRGGRLVMMAGALANGAGCLSVALAHSRAMYFCAWIVLGLGMRLTLYDAAFATLARISGPQARRPIAQITLLGGLASTVFWPLGHVLSQLLGWRAALVAYACCAILTIPLCLAIPDRTYVGPVAERPTEPARPADAAHREIMLAGVLYAVITAGANFLNAGMSAEMIAVLTGLGLSASMAVWISTLRGIGQSAARLCEIVFGRRLDPLSLNLLACAFLPLSFVAGLFSGASVEMGVAFAFLYGACNGILTITRGTLPLVLFDHRNYGSIVGTLIVPSFVLSAAAPVIYALAIDWAGVQGALHLSTGVAILILVSAGMLKLLFARKRAPHAAPSFHQDSASRQ